METTKQVNELTRLPMLQGCPLNENRHKPLSMGRSVFPDDAVARICKPSRAVTTSGRARTRGWRLVFERRTAPFIEPLMGYAGSDDTMAQVELSFPTLQSAVRYAERQGLTYVVQTPTGQTGNGRSQRDDHMPVHATSAHAFSDATLDRLGLAALQESYGRALDGAANRNDPPGPESWTSPMGVVRDPTLTLEAKRSILMNWAWTEYLIDQATNEGMPENNRPPHLDEVEQALLALEREVAADRDVSGTRKAAKGAAMDPNVVFDCHEVLPNRFALTLAAAAGRRALARGAEPRLDTDDASVAKLALHEIVAGMFRERELAPFVPGAGGRR